MVLFWEEKEPERASMAGPAAAYNPAMAMGNGNSTEHGPLGLAPDSRIEGELAPPGSKSEAQRALLVAALCDGPTVVTGLPDGDDVRACLELVEACGTTVYRASADRALVEGLPPASTGGLRPPRPVQVGESGTLARFATAALALCGQAGVPITIHARGSLLLRRSPALFRALAACGVQMPHQNVEGGWPVELVPVIAPARIPLARPSSSQEVSALLIVAAAWPEPIRIEVTGRIPSRPYVEITCHVLSYFGVTVAEERTTDGSLFLVEGLLRAPRAPVAVEPDASGAAVALAGACLSGGELLVPGLTPASPQGDVRVAEHLRAFGCRTTLDARGLSAGGFPERGAELDLTGEPDLAPPLAAVAAGAALRHGATSLLTGLGTLPGKECDRIAVLASGLSRVGFAVDSGDDFLRIGPQVEGHVADRVALNPYDDHRMAFAFALFGLLLPGVLVRNPGCVAKSWARFWWDMERAGAVLESDAIE